jgi:hypothetical protein
LIKNAHFINVIADQQIFVLLVVVEHHLAPDWRALSLEAHNVSDELHVSLAVNASTKNVNED